MEVGNDENLDMLLKDWDIDRINTPKDLSKEDAIQYVKQLNLRQKQEKHLNCGLMMK